MVHATFPLFCFSKCKKMSTLMFPFHVQNMDHLIGICNCRPLLPQAAAISRKSLASRWFFFFLVVGFCVSLLGCFFVFGRAVLFHSWVNECSSPFSYLYPIKAAKQREQLLSSGTSIFKISSIQNFIFIIGFFLVLIFKVAALLPLHVGLKWGMLELAIMQTH